MKILVLGAGRMGHGAVFDLIHNSPDVESVTVVDFELAKAEAVAKAVGSERVTARQIDAGNYSEAVELMRGHDSVISCVNYWHNVSLSKAAIETGTNFCDLGGNNYIVDEQLALDAEAKAAGINIIPDCGLAPGMVSILAMHGAATFDEVEEIHIRVGGLPQYLALKPEAMETARTGAVACKALEEARTAPTKAEVERKVMQYLYAESDQFVFMDNINFEQIMLCRWMWSLGLLLWLLLF